MLQPDNLTEYIGQDKIKKSIKVSLNASKMRNEPFPHILLHGASGLGKTTLANIIANEFDSSCHHFLAPVIESHNIIYDALLEIHEHEFMFIDEIHALPKKLQETLYTAMTDYTIDNPMGWGGRINLRPFTLIGATTDLGLLAPPFRERFGFIVQLTRYSYEEIKKIIYINAHKMQLDISDTALDHLSLSSRRNPRTANRLLERCRDTATVSHTILINEPIVRTTLRNLDIDENGLTSNDFEILDTLIYKFDLNPVGLKALSLQTNIDEKAIESIYEPHLIEMDLIERTPRGRVATTKGVEYFAKNN
tara:strand:- start:5383 stop:6303 length:921 start_codon:yes stop_codon:yes gene_type:complete